MTKDNPKDDLTAVREVVAALGGFQQPEQERILRWAREKLGLSAAARQETPPLTPLSPNVPSGVAQDIKSFIGAKNPRSDNQFAAAVAYYYKFEAPANQRRDTITGNDLQEATRTTGRRRLTRPRQTLVNAHGAGYIDKGPEKGTYQINTVGENLVAMALPEGSPQSAKKASRRAGRGAKKRKTGSRRGTTAKRRKTKKR